MSREDGLGSISPPAHNALVSISTSPHQQGCPITRNTHTHTNTQTHTAIAYASQSHKRFLSLTINVNNALRHAALVFSCISCFLASTRWLEVAEEAAGEAVGQRVYKGNSEGEGRRGMERPASGAALYLINTNARSKLFRRQPLPTRPPHLAVERSGRMSQSDVMR